MRELDNLVSRQHDRYDGRTNTISWPAGADTIGVSADAIGREPGFGTAAATAFFGRRRQPLAGARAAPSRPDHAKGKGVA